MNSRIRLMPDALANQIAAGEVVERPASVVKELVENSLDARAKSITISIEASGKQRIRVIDDGFGMTPEDVRLALKRHATSKLFSSEELSQIVSLGFRGEAIPSIASVSRFLLQSREQTSDAGFEIRVEGGSVVGEAEIGMPMGTIVDVRNLFFNVPARRKFLRADVTESSHIAYLVSNLAAANPSVRFRLEHGPRKIVDVASVASRGERLYQLEKSWAEGAIQVLESVGSLAVEAWLSPPAGKRGQSKRLHLFVNGRPVKDRILSHAVMEAYRQLSSRSGTPLVYLFVEMPPDRMDVNVHPAKSEVRFVEQQHVHSAVFSIVRGGLTSDGRAPEILLRRDSAVGGMRFEGGRGASMVEETSQSGLGGRQSGVSSGSAPESIDGRELAASLFGAAAGVDVAPGKSDTFVEFADVAPSPVGQFRQSYIVAADEENLWLIDQHAAHERILYEQLLERPVDAGQQLLLAPMPLELTPVERVTMEEELERFTGFGYEIEPFGSGDYLLRAVPANLSGHDPVGLLRSTLSQVEQDCRSSTVVEAHGRIAARLACHAAIKVNHSLTREKMTFVIDSLWKSSRPTTCPHGRPTTLRIGREQLERNFGRI